MKKKTEDEIIQNIRNKWIEHCKILIKKNVIKDERNED